MAPLPTGTVTFLFTDLEGSTRLWEEQPDAMREALTAHDAIVRGAIEAHGGLVVSEMGDGMAAAFTSATEAVLAAVEAQIGLGARSWDATGPLRARMGLHLGEGQLPANDLDRAGAVVAAADRTLRGPAPIPLLRARTFIAYFTGDFDQAAGLAEVWATQARASADRYELGDALALLGWAWNQSAPATAVEFFDEAMQVARAGGVPSSIAMTLSGCAGSLPLEEADRALELLDEAIEVGTEVGDHMAVDLARLNKGMIAARRGDWRTALRLAADTARQQLDVGDLSGLPGSLGLAASAFSMVSRHEVAAVLLGRAGSMSPMNAFVGFGMAADTETVRDALGDEELAKLEERGATQDLRTVVDYLCSEAELLLGGT